MDSQLPIFLQIAHYLEDQILTGYYQSNDKVPSTNEFAQLMDINPATANKGLNELVDQGILYKKRGVGMFVSEQALDYIIQKRRQAFKERVLPDFLKEARQLNISQADLIQMIKEDNHA